MEKSIETIWKEGFLKNDVLVAPKLNDLYNQKSTHIIDKYKRMFRINLVAIIVFSFFLLIASFPAKIPIMGISFFVILNALVLINRRLIPGLEQIDKNASSYEYLKAFDGWMKENIQLNKKMATFYYPLFFLSTVLGFWFSSSFQETLPKILGEAHEIYFVYGIPIFWAIPVVVITAVLAIFGGRIFLWDLNIVYGRVLKRLAELIADMEELRK
jgi:hypothetical protein